MKFTELKENAPLEVIEITKHIVYSKFPNPITDKREKDSNIVSEKKQIQMKIFTGGEIVKESEEVTQNIKEYYIDKRKYRYDVDTLKTKKYTSKTIVMLLLI